MNGNTYIITSSSAGGEIIFRYDADGMLIAYEMNADLTQEQYARLVATFPFQESDAKAMAEKPNSKVQLVPADLSFERFWNAYNYKEGKKVMAENSWKRLSTKDKAEALSYIAEYNHKLIVSGVAKAYPSTYINQKYWENKTSKK